MDRLAFLVLTFGLIPRIMFAVVAVMPPETTSAIISSESLLSVACAVIGLAVAIVGFRRAHQSRSAIIVGGILSAAWLAFVLIALCCFPEIS